MAGNIDVFMGEQDPFGDSGGSSGIQHGGRFGAIPIDGLEGFLSPVQNLIKIPITLGADNFFQESRGLHFFQLGPSIIRRKNYFGSGMIHQQLKFVLLEKTGKGHRHSAGFEHPEIKNDPLDRIGCTKPDEVSRFYAHLNQGSGYSIG